MSRNISFIAILVLLIFNLSGCIDGNVDNSITINNNESIADKDNSNEEKSEMGIKGEEGNSETVVEEGNKEENNESASDKLIKEIFEKAKEGGVIDCDFKVKYNIIDDVEKEWGEEEKFDYIADAKGSYYTFLGKNEAFGVNKGGVIFEVRTFSDKVKEVTLKEIINSYGTPDYDIISSLNERIIGYIVNDEFKLLLVFNNESENNLKLDHYSVLYPKGTVNLMADDPGREW
ncbi:Uncharacterised protein [uncultured Clostridium sp.]|uniref:YjgB family protein n=1 Tax=uncultured Clostridium sp. TaxID=59620 RepID=UPI000820A6A9|nr:YjgB family protein [uncultured Clostridium sp.]SCJ46297.1 Uncharacterised protein [uncultured Clostridium sp.]